MTTPAQGLFTASLPELYERYLVAPLFRPFAGSLLRHAGLTPRDRLLDVACGTGVVLRVARETLGESAPVVGVDASPAMLAVARATTPAIDWREGDAAHLPVGAGETFDLVTCHQGVQFFKDKPAAAREMRRVLAPGGRVALATWRAARELPLMRDLQQVVERHVGPVFDVRHGFGDAGEMRQLLADAGFAEVRVEAVTRTIRIADPTVFPRLNAMALVGMSEAGKTMTEAQRAEVVAAIADECAGVVGCYVDGGDLVFDLATNVGIGQA